MLEIRKERFVHSNFALLLIHTQSSPFTHIWYEGLSESKHFSEDTLFVFVYLNPELIQNCHICDTQVLRSI